MATDAAQSQKINDTSSNQASAAMLSQDAGVRRMDPSAPPAEATRKATGYGLPCAKCHLYYPADVDICPTCHHPHRVAPVAPKVQTKIAPATVVEEIPDTAKVEKEREEFLRQFKSQLIDAHAGAANVGAANTSDAPCKMSEQHPGDAAHAEICKSCYERLQERVDVCEAALYMDMKEAAQIVYDAVWSDPSEPTKTYQNAAIALLAELRKRAGVTTLRGPFQTLSD
jgi:hypothetical protein